MLANWAYSKARSEDRVNDPRPVPSENIIRKSLRTIAGIDIAQLIGLEPVGKNP